MKEQGGTTNTDLERENAEIKRKCEELLETEQKLRRSYEELQLRVERRTREFQESYGLLQSIINYSPAVIYFKDTRGRYLLVNNAFVRLFSIDLDWVMGKTDYDIFPEETADSLSANDREVMRQGVAREFEESIVVSGEARVYIASKFPLRNAEGIIYGVAGISIDITELKKAEDTIKYQAYHDPLTGLPNRALFEMYLDLEIAQARRNEQKLAVVVLNLDRFKTINDTLGHAAGDRLIREVASRLGSLIRQSDTLAHFGGNEFAVLLADLKRPEDVTMVAADIVAAMQTPFSVGPHELYTTASIGIGLYPEDGDNPGTLLVNADIAMAQAKQQGGNRYQFFNPAVNVRTVERLLLENRLRQTLARGELVVYYQPQVDIETWRITCLEALVRWRHPELGMLTPKQFIPIAEEIGFITAIDEWVLHTACLQNKAWQDSGLPAVCITVNLSAPEFHRPTLADTVDRVLKETGLDPRYLNIEITEGTAIQALELAVPAMGKLTGMGIGLSIDDFGTGYSSLSYLKKFPVQKIKIDQSFIRDVASHSEDQAIVNAVIAMGHSLRLSVVAEGVETPEQLSFLRSSRCDEVQGFIFSEPAPADAVKGLLQLRDQ